MSYVSTDLSIRASTTLPQPALSLLYEYMSNANARRPNLDNHSASSSLLASPSILDSLSGQYGAINSL